MATTTVHLELELVSDLSSIAFIKALRRFVAIQERFARLYSDNDAITITLGMLTENCDRCFEPRRSFMRDAVASWIKGELTGLLFLLQLLILGDYGKLELTQLSIISSHYRRSDINERLLLYIPF